MPFGVRDHSIRESGRVFKPFRIGRKRSAFQNKGFKGVVIARMIVTGKHGDASRPAARLGPISGLVGENSLQLLAAEAREQVILMHHDDDNVQCQNMLTSG
jgi:hypothetical protein